MRAAVYGACHAEALRGMLASDPRTAGIEFIPLVECFRMSEAEITEFETTIAPRLDVFIFQPVTALSLGERFSASQVIGHLRPGCQKIAFQYPHLELYTPFHNYPAAELGRAPFDYLDFEIVGQYLHGTRRADVAARLAERDLDDATVREIARWSIEELAAREHGDTGPVDIEITGIVRDRMEHEMLFHTINHPGLAVMAHVAESAIRLMDEAGHADASLAHPPLTDPFTDIHIPVHPAIQRVYGLSEDAEFLHKGQRVSQDEAIARTYDYLEGFDRELILASVDRLTAARPWFEAAL
ncbi:MAG: hypothetical protein JHC98_04845 [Thermoleophilaceae bacterium]|nr:hypothetical protein [Thermoleophilaceae bacterium]